MLSDWQKFQKSSLKPQMGLKCSLYNPLKTLWFFLSIENTRWPPLQDKFNIEPYGENISKLFQSETNEQFESKHSWNVPWIVLYKMGVFCVDRKSKMSAVTRHSFNIRPHGRTEIIFSPRN